MCRYFIARSMILSTIYSNRIPAPIHFKLNYFQNNKIKYKYYFLCLLFFLFSCNDYSISGLSHGVRYKVCMPATSSAFKFFLLNPGVIVANITANGSKL